MAKNIPSRRRVALAAAIAIARNKTARNLIARNRYTRNLAFKALRSAMSNPESRRIVLSTARKSTLHSRPLMLGAASVGVVSAAGAAAIARAKHASDRSTDTV